MATYSNTRHLLAAKEKGEITRTVMVEVDTELLATLMGRRFTGPDGSVVSMEKVSIHYDAHVDLCIAEPVLMRMEPMLD